MCFGNQNTETKTTNSTGSTQYTPDPAIKNAALGNVNFAQNLQSTGFKPYTGETVAGFSPQQQQSFGMTGAIAGNGTGAQASDMINAYAAAPASSVNASTIASGMSPYMSQYVAQSLQPQLAMQQTQFDDQNRQLNAQATSSGAFGDSRAGVQAGNTALAQALSRSGLVANAYNSAFNTAIGASAQDQANSLSAQGTNANLNETALGRSLQGSSALQGLQNQQLGVAGAVNTAGQQQTAQQQAQLNSDYNQWQMAQQYPFQTTDLVNKSLATAVGAVPASSNTTGDSTSTTSKPDNSGMGALGSVLGAVAPVIMASDRRLKENINNIGKLNDGTPVYSFNYIGHPGTTIGLMAQDVEKTTPEAVVTMPSGFKGVDYSKATERARGFAPAI